MSKFTFTKHSSYEGQPETTVSLSTDAILLPEVLEAFEDFLRGCGFRFEGHLDFAQDFDEYLAELEQEND